MIYYLYEIKNKIDGKIYVGVHKTTDENDGYMGSGKVLSRAIKKYGVQNFSKTILERFTTKEEMFAREKEVVNDEFLSRDDVYNLKIGGNGGFDYINSNDEIAAKKSEAYSGSGNPFYGKQHKKESIEKIASAASMQWKGVPKSEEHKRKIKESNTGKTFTEERKNNISAAKKGKPTWNKGKTFDKIECPHCGKIGGGSNMQRWHFDKCKFKE